VAQKSLKQVKEKSSSNKERVTSSDIVVLLTPTEITLENKNIKLANSNLEKVFKGQFDNGKSLALPSSIEVGKSYLVFLKVGEYGGYSITTRQDSVIGLAGKNNNKLYA